MKKLIVANWKMAPESEEHAKSLLSEFGRIKVPAGVEAVVCPPTIYLHLAKEIIGNMDLGAQDAFWTDRDAATGEVSPAMLKDVGIKYVIVGHSERREKMHETDEDVWRKIAAVVRDGLTPIICVGEPWEVRSRGMEDAKQYVGHQIITNTASLTSLCSALPTMIIAYEPIWAISTSGSGREENAEDAAVMVGHIRHVLEEQCGVKNSCVLYGGSVNGQTAEKFLSRPEICGALVGHASLNAEEFQKILKSAA